MLTVDRHDFHRSGSRKEPLYAGRRGAANQIAWIPCGSFARRHLILSTLQTNPCGCYKGADRQIGAHTAGSGLRVTIVRRAGSLLD
jgi:hypothetical protein